MLDGKSVKILRSDLYKEIWEIAVTGVSKKYDIPYPKLIKICKKLNIPVPFAGYWTKLSFGKSAEKTPLPPEEDTEIDLVYESLKHTKEPKEKKTPVIAQKVTFVESKPKEAKGTPKNEIPVEDAKPKTPYKIVYNVNNVYQRDKLYEEIWAKPAVEVAEQYGVSDVTILKMCKSLEVPVPPRGYWAKVRAGEMLQKPPLKQTTGMTAKMGPRTYEGSKSVQIPVNHEKLTFLDDTERQLVLAAAEQIEIPDVNRAFHKKVSAYNSEIKQWNKDDQKSEGSKKNPRSYSDSPPFLAGIISDESLPRVFTILDTLYRQVEILGGLINDDLSLNIRGEVVRISIHEAQDQIDHVMTKKEARDLLVYEDAMRHHSWGSKPQIRKYDYVYNGRLVVEIKKGKYIRDNENMKIESRLGDMLIDLYEVSEIIRVERLAHEDAERKRKEDERLREVRRNRYNLEVERTFALENAASDYDKACKIRSYVVAIEKAIDPDQKNDEATAWIDWALKKADWIDPTIARKDEYFGKREHEKCIDQKVLRKTGY